MKIFAKITRLLLIMILLTIAGINPAKAEPIPPPPNPLWSFELLIEQANIVQGFPFSLMPGLNGADKTKFIEDQLINRDELLHMTAFLEGQLVIAIRFSPDSAELLQLLVNNSRYLLRRFPGIATATDGKGSKAICMEDIARLFSYSNNERSKDPTKLE